MVKDKKFLGLKAGGHDTSAALIVNGKIVVASEEEKFDRIKHSNNFPIKSINFCLRKKSLKINDIETVSISMDWGKRARSRFNFFWHENNPVLSKKACGFALDDLNRKINIENILRNKFKYKGEITFLDHHDCHAATCYFPSKFNSTAILTVDGAGEEASTRIYTANGVKIEKKLQINFPNSLGMFYSLITDYLGFKIDSDEGKVMGLASYGDDSLVAEMKKVIKPKRDGLYQINEKYFNFYNEKSFFSEFFFRIFGPKRNKNQKITKRHQNIAKAAQVVLEDLVFGLVQHTKTITKQDNLCLSGGVFLNSIVNGKIFDLKKFNNIYIYPVAGDGGTSVGAAFISFYRKHKRKIFNKSNRSPFIGYQSNNSEIIREIKKYKLNFLKPKNIYQEAANLLAQNKIIGWYSGKTEFGPRALGNRSILADPRDKKNKNRINKKIKFRESFRPFAPSVLEEFARDYFKMKIESPYMILAFEVKKNKRPFIPAVTHVDNTARIQTVSKKENEPYWNLINEFYKITGIPVLLNTSFNCAGEPMVNTPKDAINVFLKSNLDAIVLEKYIIFK